MIIKMARFKVKKDKLKECLEAIRGFKVSFMHLMKFKDGAAEEHHRGTEHVKKFVAILYPNCEQEPIFTDLAEVV